MAQTTTTSTPIALYKNPDEGDLTLRTSDQVDFFVHRRRLADVSSVFADMFSFPQPAIEGKVADERPVVDVSEKSGVWEWLLPYIYVAEEPNIALGQIYDLLEATRKYQMPGVRSRLKIHLMRSDFLDEEPYAVYALACVGGFEDVARLAARRTLRLPVYPEDAPEFAHVSGRAIVRLLDYRRRCSDATSALFSIGTGSPRELTERSAWLCDRLSTYGRHSCCMVSVKFPAVTAPFQRPRTEGSQSPWLPCVDRLKEELRYLPDATAVLGALQPTFLIDSAKSCHACLDVLREDLTSFSAEAQEKIKTAIARVPFVLVQ